MERGQGFIRHSLEWPFVVVGYGICPMTVRADRTDMGTAAWVEMD